MATYVCDICRNQLLSDSVTLSATSNQARGLGEYAIDFLRGKWPEPALIVWDRLELFHTDSVACGVAALAEKLNAPHVLQQEALQYPASRGVGLLGNTTRVMPEKAVLANCSAVRELDANGTNFGYNPATGYTCGEFGHNDFYPVAVAAAQQQQADGLFAMRGMLCIDEIRGRLAECFALKNYKIDHVLHGAIASATVYAAMMGATAEQIESAIGLVVAHYVPFRAIRYGEQLSDSKGASAALSAEVAVLAAQRAMRGFRGPADIFRNPQAIFCLFQPQNSYRSPFDLTLSTQGDQFAIMGMHFKLGLYEHQSAGAIAGLHALLQEHAAIITNIEKLKCIRITIYEPAFGIIGDPHKRNPTTRQSADHSMLYIVATLLRKAVEQQCTDWQSLMLLPQDYNSIALQHALTRKFMQKIEFRHGGQEYDALYPEGIPTTIEMEHADLGWLSSGLVMYPLGHARNFSPEARQLLQHKMHSLVQPALDNVNRFFKRLCSLRDKSAEDIQHLYDFEIQAFTQEN